MKPTNLGWKKYGSIIIGIVLLFITTLTIIILAYFNAQQAASNADKINASARFSALTQAIKNSVYDIDIYSKDMRLSSLKTTFSSRLSSEALLQQLQTEEISLRQSTTTFDNTLNTFVNGGRIETEAGEFIELEALSSPENRKVLQSIDEIWRPYHRLVDNFGQSLRQGKLDEEAINYATDYARIFNDRLSALAEKITDNLSRVANAQSRNTQLYLTIGFAIALLIGTYLIFVAFRQLIKSDRALMHSQRELSDIMETITEGLFLIDEDLNIGEQHSAELESIIRSKNIANKNFTDLLKNRVSDRDVELTTGFLEQLFNPRIYEDLIDSLNPLNRVKVLANESNNIDQTLYLAFAFNRVYEGKQIKNVLVSVRDITETVMLEERLEKERVENEAKLEMLSTILQVEPKLMNEFLQHTKDGADKVNAILKSSEKNKGDKKDLLRVIGRIIHGLKGEASALSLDGFTNKYEGIEDDIASIRRKTKLTGDDFIGLVMHLDELLTMNEKARELFDRVSSGKLDLENLGNEGQDANHDSLHSYLSGFAQKISDRHGHKKVCVDCHEFNQKHLNDQQSTTLREISLQLMRNAIVHGIETPQQRVDAGKPEQGRIHIQLREYNDDFWLYSFKDDGKGIDFQSLRQLAAQDPHYQQKEIAELTQNDLIRFMFSSGVSTAEQSSEDAGRGVGMDVIRVAVKDLGGKLQIDSEAGKYTSFLVKFPK